jgi:hypothetical protein
MTILDRDGTPFCGFCTIEHWTPINKEDSGKVMSDPGQFVAFEMGLPNNRNFYYRPHPVTIFNGRTIL